MTELSTSLEITKQKIAELQAAILSDHPKLPFLLETIRQNLQQDPLNVTLLTEDEISKLILGLSTASNIALTVPKKSTKKVNFNDVDACDF